MCMLAGGQYEMLTVKFFHHENDDNDDKNKHNKENFTLIRRERKETCRVACLSSVKMPAGPTFRAQPQYEAGTFQH